MPSTKQQILLNRLEKLKKHQQALSEYKTLIDALELNNDIYQADYFLQLEAQQRAILEAYLKRFASLQDYMGAKLFPLVIDMSGIVTTKTSEVLAAVEREGLIDNLEQWIALRDLRNALEHDYPDTLEYALNELKLCVQSYSQLDHYAQNILTFSREVLHAPI
jgi:hypothetical protein